MFRRFKGDVGGYPVYIDLNDADIELIRMLKYREAVRADEFSVSGTPSIVSASKGEDTVFILRPSPGGGQTTCIPQDELEYIL